MALKKGEYQAVSLYKFCLCILVVFIHNKTDEYFQLTDKQYMFFEFFTFYVAQIAVPSFMILSAYLLFRGYRTGNAFSKIRSRLSKLAPAYIFGIQLQFRIQFWLQVIVHRVISLKEF